MSSTSIRCTPVSTSGWCAAGCGTPHSRSTSGSTRASAPQSRSTSNMRLGRGSIRPRDSSCQTRSATSASTSPASTIARHSAIVSGATREVRPARREARQPQDAHRVFGEGVRRRGAARRRCRSRRPPNGSISAPSSACGDRVDGEVAPRQVLFERDRRIGVDDEAAVARRRLALGARQRVFLVRLRMQEDREVACRPACSPRPASARAWRRRRPSRGRRAARRAGGRAPRRRRGRPSWRVAGRHRLDCHRRRGAPRRPAGAADLAPPGRQRRPSGGARRSRSGGG